MASSLFRAHYCVSASERSSSSRSALRSTPVNRLKGSGVYRAVYTILEEHRVCLVFIVGPHENIYTKAQRRYDALKRSGEL